MALPLKTAGVRELEAFQRRLTRQFALGRIGAYDHEYILERVQEIEARISEMYEEGEEDYS